MTKRETAEKYIRDGGCERFCGNCAFRIKCARKYGQLGYPGYALDLAKSYLAKQEKKMKQDDGWKDMSLTALPDDIDHTKDPRDQYNIERKAVNTGRWIKTEADRWWLVIKNIEEGAEYIYRPIQKPQVCHEEIMTKWWELDTDFHGERIWSKVEHYKTSIIYGREKEYLIGGKWRDLSWFTGRKSATIPLEGN